MRKQLSTNTINLNTVIALCPISYTISIVGGRWKPLIIDRLMSKEELRYSELKKLIPPVTERMLTAQLKEMEQDGLVERVVYDTKPPKVVAYRLTARGHSLKGVLHELLAWGQENAPAAIGMPVLTAQ
ncbi:MAG TPA: helix-turn-helix domain-containing protein [Chitinophaga sp.]|uniref:winged helix-turn-helix transcriptional regulator n=1 Tax=Chitinophaga sp. TaxID=1869181 RepID=UPI002C24E799|nr:helix-turn-helix domain-containing protein [Chitinophaga sp.]HVI49511.1 helix-turn-helix domain-containing protein [Chitinophaga sp.]